jgi:hypothetical protein
MGKFEPSIREKEQVFNLLPETKENLVKLLLAATTMPEKYVRSLIWNMKRIGLIYTFQNQIKKV